MGRNQESVCESIGHSPNVNCNEKPAKQLLAVSSSKGQWTEESLPGPINDWVTDKMDLEHGAQEGILFHLRACHTTINSCTVLCP